MQKIGVDGYHLIAGVRINGNRALVVVDTGASRTVFDKNMILDLEKKRKAKKHPQLSSGLGTNSMESQTLVISRLELGKLVIKNYTAVLLDLGNVNSSYSELNIPTVCGVLGSDILKKFKGTISYSKKILTLEK